MPRPELIIPYPSDQQGAYITFVRPNGLKSSCWLSQSQCKNLDKIVVKSEKRRLDAYKRYLAKPKPKASSRNTKIINEPPRVSFELLSELTESSVEPTADIISDDSTSDDSSSDDEFNEHEVVYTPQQAKLKAYLERKLLAPQVTLPKSKAERARTRTP